ncbi:MAG TPA: membrane protein insertase YidC [Dehalococcoidia bacterium]|nr:membrane protein insertase YidC [Dehalococcoidia bacterium]
MSIGEIWNLIILSPVINILIVVSGYLFNSFGLAIIALTIIVRTLTLPLTLKQLRATKAMQELQPKLLELQKKYGRDRARLAQEQMRLYKESGVSPAGCMLPMLVQLPIWIALFQSIIRVLAVVPEDFLSLSQHLYTSWPMVFSLVPLDSQFLWLDLAMPDRFLLLPLLVGGTMWLQQKMVMPRTVDPRQQAQSTMMLWMMPLMFAFLTTQFPSGLALYWVVSNIISIIVQYKITGWGGLLPAEAKKQAGKDKKYIKHISKVEEKPTDYADVGADIGADVGADIEEGKTGAARPRYQPSLRAIKRHSKKGKRPRGK